MKSSLTRWFVKQFSPKWTVGALGVVRDAQGRVLLLEHRLRPKPWGLPGGFVAWPETPQAGLVRELQEEVGLVFEAEEFRFVSCLQSDRLPLLEFVYERVPLGGMETALALRLQASEVKSAKWFDAEGIAALEGMLQRHKALLLGLLASPR